jgi:recombination protein RecA
MAAVLQLDELRARFGMPSEEPGLHPKALPLGWPEMDAALPEGGLPRGVIELASAHALGGGTSVALAAVRAAQAKDARAWCAWLDPEGTLYAPGVAMAGVDLARLLVVRPERADLGRVAVKVAAARACDVIVVDMDPVAGARAVVPLWSLGGRPQTPGGRKRKKTWPPEVLVRKLALLAAAAGASVLLLTDSLVPRATSWPVALRLELSRTPGALSVRVAKDRRGKSRLAKTSIPLRTLPSLLGAGA